MDWKADLAFTSSALTKLRAINPEACAGFTALHNATMEDGALTKREKELIAIAIGIATHCTDCVGYHMRAGIKAGITREDVAETVGVAMMMGGGPSYMYGAKALSAFDQLSSA